MNIGELYSNGVLRGPGNCIMDPGQAGVPNTPNYVPTWNAERLKDEDSNRKGCSALAEGRLFRPRKLDRKNSPDWSYN